MPPRRTRNRPLPRPFPNLPEPKPTFNPPRMNKEQPEYTAFGEETKIVRPIALKPQGRGRECYYSSSDEEYSSSDEEGGAQRQKRHEVPEIKLPHPAVLPQFQQPTIFPQDDIPPPPPLPALNIAANLANQPPDWELEGIEGMGFTQQGLHDDHVVRPVNFNQNLFQQYY